MQGEGEMQQPTVLYLGHPHRLTVLEKVPDASSPCKECGRPWDSLPVFHCAQCDFNLHLLCGPLPTKISLPDLLDEHLSLADLYAEDDSGEYYCDLCEEKRDPRECVYFSKEYNYFVHLKCAMPEVLSSLKGEKGDVELRTLGKFIPGQVIGEGLISETTAQWEKQITDSTQTLKELYDSLDENENMEFDNLSIPPADDSSDYAMMISHKRDALEQLLKRLDAVSVPREELIKFYNWDAKVVDVKGHQITWDFAYIMKELMDKHEELIAESSLSPKVKTLVFVLLCDLVYSMYRTNIEDVTEQMLMNWWGCLKVVQHANFQVKFVTEQLKKVATAYSGLVAKKTNEDTMASLDKQIDKLSKELDELRERREQHKKFVESSSKTVTSWLAEALALSCKTVGADLL